MQGEFGVGLGYNIADSFRLYTQVYDFDDTKVKLGGELKINDNFSLLGEQTDLRQPMSALLCTATGTSTVVENIFESRFRHLSEMERMGARVRIYEQTAVIEGVPQLHGAAVEATDLRAGAALVIAGLMAQGTTEIYNTHFIDRGYEHLEEKLNSLGAKISRTRE